MKSTSDNKLGRQSSGAPSVLFIVRSLDRGGAERQLANLAIALHRRKWPVHIGCFYTGGALQGEVEGAGVPVIDLRKGGRWDFLSFSLRLREVVRELRPDIIHSYLTAANIVAILCRQFFRRSKVVWGIRAANMDYKQYDRFSRVIAKVEARLSNSANLIIANSEAGRQHCVTGGFPADKIRVISNGIDTGRFVPNRAAGRRFREQFGIPAGKTVVGIIARLDPMKGHEIFLQAAKTLLDDSSDWHFVCLGDGVAPYRQSLLQISDNLGLEKHVSWIAELQDVEDAYNSLDILVSASLGEGFSNGIAEAMACGCPCVATDVGDSDRIVGDYGEIVEPDDSDHLASGIKKLLYRVEENRSGLRDLVRQRIVNEFSIAKLAASTSQQLKRLVNQ